jgi:hypothetical protein
MKLPKIPFSRILPRTEIPRSLEQRTQSILRRKGGSSEHKVRWAAAVAACFLLGFLFWHRLYSPVLMNRQPTARPTQSAKLNSNSGSRQSQTSASAYSALALDTAFPTPAILRIAERTATCALTPMFLPRDVSNFQLAGCSAASIPQKQPASNRIGSSSPRMSHPSIAQGQLELPEKS